MSPSCRQTVKCVFILVAMDKVVHSKSSDEHEPSLTLRVALKIHCCTYSEHVDTSIERQFWVENFADYNSAQTGRLGA